ncbi:MAG: hypothetical protein V2A58_03685 [Planctomycetota bacterium]
MELDELQELSRRRCWHETFPLAETGSRFTLRERFRRTMSFEKTDKIPHFEFGYWNETLPEWHKQGLPPEIDDERKAYEYFGIEDSSIAPVDVGIYPGFPEETIEETEERRIFRDGQGVLREINKSGFKSIPHFIDFPVKSRADFEAYRAQLDPDAPGRYGEDWDELVAAYRDRDFPLGINRGSMIGVPRGLTGFEGIALLTYDDPDFVEEMAETFCRCVEGSIQRALQEVDFDFAMGWEDICFNSGPIVNPAFFDRVIRPRYERVSDLLRSHGVFVSAIDCDGNVMPIAESFLAGGVNCMFPVEVRGGTDARALRDRFGKKVLFMGGVDKHAVAKGPRAIDAELERLAPLVEEGGFIPHIDHRCPADVSLANYRYYLKRKREILNVGGREAAE